MEPSNMLDMTGTIHESLGIRTVEADADRVVLEMDVGPRVHQPFGLLHGGASSVMAESAASIGAFLNCDPAREASVGVELNISHLRSMSRGLLRATAVPVRKGRTLHVWSVDLADDRGRLIATSRCTLAIRSVAGPGR